MKRGYFFMADGTFAVVVLVVGFFLITSSFNVEDTSIPMGMAAENTIELLSTIRVNELCSNLTRTNCVCTSQGLQEVCSSHGIGNRNETVLEYLGELYRNGHWIQAGYIFYDLTEEDNFLKRDMFGTEFKINDRVLNSTGVNRDSSKEVVSAKRVIFGYSEDEAEGTVTWWGPYVVEVNLWTP